ncbi:MAG: hypothetical protein ACRC7G_14115, partial [Beijerinckiaceae bacterium]
SALALPFAPIGVWLTPPASAQSAGQNVLIENLSFTGKDGAKFSVPKIELTGSNLSQAEVRKLFDPTTSKEDSIALSGRLKADRLSIPALKAEGGKDGFTMTFTGLVAEKIDQGRFGKLALAGMRASDTKTMSMNLRPISAEGIDASQLLEILRTGGDMSRARQIRMERLTGEGLEMTVPDKDTSATAPGGNMVKIAMGAITAATDYAGNTPSRTRFDMKAMTVEGPPASKMTQQLKELGYDRLSFDVGGAAAYDAAKKLFDLSEFTIAGQGMGRIGLKGAFSNLDALGLNGDQGERMLAFLGSSIDRLELSVGNEGLFEKGFSFAAKQNGKAAPALIAESKAMAVGLLPIMLGADAGVMKLAAAIGQFMDNPKVVRVSVTGKNGPVRVIDFTTMKTPQDVLKVVNIDASAQ